MAQKNKWVFPYIILVVSMTLIYVWQRVEIIEMGYEIAQIKKENIKLGQEKEQLEIKKTMLSSLKRVEKIAKEEMSMVSEKIKVIFLRED